MTPRWLRALFDDKSPEPSMDAAERRHRKRLLAREEKVVRDLERTWRGVETELQRLIDAVIARIEDAETAGIEPAEAWLYEQDRYQLLLKQTREQIDRYAAGAMQRTEEAQQTSAQAGADDGYDLMQRTEIRARFVRLPAEQVEALSGFLADGSPLAEIFSTFGDDAARALKDRLLQGLALGENPRVIGRKLAQEARGMGRDRAIVIARTESIRAYRTAQIESYRANSDVIVGWRWTASRSVRTCVLCWAMHGTIHKLSDPMATHLVCRCTQSPVTENAPRRSTGEEEFAKLSERDQKTILGPGKFDLYKAGQMSLRDVVEDTYSTRWGAGRRVRSLRDTRTAITQGVRRERFPTSVAELKRRDIPRAGRRLGSSSQGGEGTSAAGHLPRRPDAFLPADSMVGRMVGDEELIEVLRAVEPMRERIVVRKGDGEVLLDLLGPPGQLDSPTLTKAEAQLVVGQEVWHNHPPDEDGSFPNSTLSDPDLLFSRQNRPALIAAVARDLVFIAYGPEKGWARALGSGRAFLRELERYLDMAIARGVPLEEARREALRSFCNHRRIIYEEVER